MSQDDRSDEFKPKKYDNPAGNLSSSSSSEEDEPEEQVVEEAEEPPPQDATALWAERAAALRLEVAQPSAVAAAAPAAKKPYAPLTYSSCLHTSLLDLLVRRIYSSIVTQCGGVTG